MEGFVAFDGGRFLRAGGLAFGTLIWAAPLFAQASPDPLAPLPTTPAPPAAPAPPPATTPAKAGTTAEPAASPAVTALPSTTQTTPLVQALPPSRQVAAPKDWRGVFDAIDAGQWATAQAGITALPRSVLTPVAKAEIYTARGSPIVDLASLQALLAEAPELPESEQ